MPSAAERFATLETDLKAHKDQCITDKQEFRDQFKSIHNKLWALIIGLVLHLVAVVGYLTTQGNPWDQTIEIVDRKP